MATKKPVENEEVVEEEGKEETPVEETKKPAKKVKTKSEKKPNIIVRAKNKAKDGMSKHPFITAFTGAAAGAGISIGGAFLGKKLINNHRNKQNATYIQDQNSLDPNV